VGANDMAATSRTAHFRRCMCGGISFVRERPYYKYTTN
jgi:hypothetical protein